MTTAKESWRNDPERRSAAFAWYEVNYRALEEAVKHLGEAYAAYGRVPYEGEYDARTCVETMFARSRHEATRALMRAREDLRVLTPPELLDAEAPPLVGNLAAFGVGWDWYYRKLTVT
jgi:hypothetical protein